MKATPIETKVDQLCNTVESLSKVVQQIAQDFQALRNQVTPELPSRKADKLPIL